MAESRLTLPNGKTVAVDRLFWYFLLTHIAVWTIIPAFVCPNIPLDVAEGYAWGKEWLLGSYKHPPMQAWWLEIFSWLTFQAKWAHLFASQVAIAVAFWAIWETGRRLTSDLRAFVGVTLLEGVIYYNFTSPEFNPNVLQLPFWALIGLYYHRAVRENHWSDWVLLGLFSAGGLYSKYSTVLLLGALSILALVRPETRRCLKSPGPYIAFLIAAVLFAPHMQWLLENNFLPFTYAQSRMTHGPEVPILHSAVIVPLFFVGSQILAVALGLLLFISLWDKSEQKVAERETVLRKFDRQFLMTMTFGPCLLVLISAMAFGLNIHDMWATPFWNFLGLYGVIAMNRAFTLSALQRYQLSWGLVFCFVILIYGMAAIFYPYLALKPQRFHFPGAALAHEISSQWRAIYGTELSYVGGDTWPAGNIAFYSNERPHVFINLDKVINPWIDEVDYRAKGGVVVWCIRACSYGNHQQETPTYVTKNPLAKIQEPIVLAKQTGADVPPAEIGWAIIPPLGK